jgi:hypothetical protein
MKTILTKEEKTRQEERRILFNQTKRESQIKKGKTINLVERVFSEPFQYLVFEEIIGLCLKKFPYFRKQDLILRVNTNLDSYVMPNELKYSHKLEEIQTEYEKMFGRVLKKVN